MTQLQLPRIDPDALRDRVRDVDLSRLAELGDELRHIDLDALRHLGESVERPDVDLATLRDSVLVRRVQGALGRGAPKRNAWDSMAIPPVGPTVAAGILVVLGGALLGGLVAWLYQPGKGDVRRARLRRRLGRVVRKVKRTLRPA